MAPVTSDPPREKVLTVRQRPVKAGNDRRLKLRKPFSHNPIGFFAVEYAVFIEEHNLGRIDERIAEIKRQQDAVEVFAAACRIIA